jgi:hypothetical protein
MDRAMSVNITNAYARYRSQSNALLDFAVLVAHAVPALKTEIQAVKAGTLAHLPRPDFFHKSNRSTPDDLLKTEAHYERYLASYVLLAHFSFFESFVASLECEETRTAARILSVCSKTKVGSRESSSRSESA